MYTSVTGSMLPSSVLVLVLFLITADGQQYTNSDFKGGTCETGSRQSPIDINTNNVHLIPGAQPFIFFNYNKTPLNVGVDDHTVKLTPTEKFKVGFAAGGIRGFYILDNIHFHWGSEHTVDGKRLQLEAHFVHYNSSYPDVTSALSDPTGIAVIGVLFSEGKRNQALDVMINTIRHKPPNGNPVKLGLTPEFFLPDDRSKFFRYYGSLTTPPCSESVVWTVIKSKLTMSKDQIAWFKKAPLTNGPLTSTFREVQNIGQRKVELWIASYRNKGFGKKPTNYLLALLLTYFGIR